MTTGSLIRWSGGTTAALIPANALSWAGPVLIAASVLTGLSIKAGDGVRKRKRRNGRCDAKTFQFASCACKDD